MEQKYRVRVQVPAEFSKIQPEAHIEEVFVTVSDMLADNIPMIIRHTYTNVLSVDQWSGLLDEMRREIYENDIVVLSFAHDDPIVGKVTLRNGMFCIGIDTADGVADILLGGNHYDPDMITITDLYEHKVKAENLRNEASKE